MPRSGGNCAVGSRSAASGLYAPAGNDTNPEGAKLKPLTGSRQEKLAAAMDRVAETLGIPAGTDGRTRPGVGATVRSAPLQASWAPSASTSRRQRARRSWAASHVANVHSSG